MQAGAYYTYDGDDNMVLSVVNGITTYYASSSYVVEVDGSDTTVRKIYSAGSTSLAVRTIVNDTTETLNWLLSDQTSAGSVELWVYLQSLRPLMVRGILRFGIVP